MAAGSANLGFDSEFENPTDESPTSDFSDTYPTNRKHKKSLEPSENGDIPLQTVISDRKVDPEDEFSEDPDKPQPKVRQPNIFVGLQTALSVIWENYGKPIKVVLIVIALVLFHTFLGYAIYYNFHRAIALLVLTIIAWAGVVYYFVAKPQLGGYAFDFCYLPSEKLMLKLWKKAVFRWIIYILLIGAVVTVAVVDGLKNKWRLVSLAGIFMFLAILFIFSKSPADVRWRPVLWGISLQFLLGLLVLRWSVGNAAFTFLGNQFSYFLSYTQNGTVFVYGWLVTPPNICGLSPIFAFSVLQTILFMGSVIGILYYFGIMQFLVMRMAWVMQFTMGTTGPESLSAAASIFVGTIEAPLAIRPYMLKLTTSEWFAIMTAGLSTIAGSVFAIYISFGACPVHLLCASVMSAPASLAVAKLFYPEKEESKLKRVEDLKLSKGEEKNVIEACVNGASAALDIVANVIATLIVFLALLAFFNNILVWLGDMVGIADLSFQRLMSYIFFPVAFMMGASDLEDYDARNEDLLKVAELMGIKVILNEFIAYQRLGEYISDNNISHRAQMVATYALCGFSNIGAMGMSIAGLGSLCPPRKGLLAKIAVRALIAANIACFLTACMAGLLSADVKPCGNDRNSTSTNCTVIPAA